MRALLRVIGATLLAVMMGAAHAETISYELLELPFFGDKPTQLAKGTLQYSTKDVRVESYGEGQSRWWAKEIPIAAGFSAGASIFPDEDLTGFGLWLKDRGATTYWRRLSQGGFSWDWFNRESGDVYRKLQGSGRVRVIFTAPNSQELAAVEVLEDITLRARVRPWFLMGGGDTHHLLIKKGSVLRFAGSS